jgi:hypothetical protein
MQATSAWVAGLQEVSAAVVTCGDECWVRLFDKASSELFAECPIPLDKPLITVKLLCAVIRYTSNPACRMQGVRVALAHAATARRSMSD